MAPNLPPRYQPHVRLGRDGDVEEWLATDSALDRPVLVRVLSPDASARRKAAFLAASRGAAAVVHSHLAQVYDVGDHGATPHAVVEWTGGVSIADRLLAGQGIPAEEFLANAAGLADGLAALHRSGAIHGAIDPGAVQFSASHPAKLGAFGRSATVERAAADTAALAATLRAAVTGTLEPSVRPSQVVDGVPAGVDDALDAAEAGTVDAAAFAALLQAIPDARARPRSAAWSWGWLVPGAALVAAAFLVALIGLGIDADPDSPFLFPATPSPTAPPPSTTIITTTTTTTTPPTPPVAEPPAGALTAVPDVYDPFGEGTEQDGELPNLVDGDPATAWRTERYFAPLAALGKPGVGVTFAVDGTPATMQFTATAGTSFRLRWAATVPPEPDGWEEVASGTALGAPIQVQLPSRRGGIWLLWLVDLPEQEPDVYLTAVGEVVFRP